MATAGKSRLESKAEGCERLLSARSGHPSSTKPGAIQLFPEGQSTIAPAEEVLSRSPTIYGWFLSWYYFVFKYLIASRFVDTLKWPCRVDFCPSQKTVVDLQLPLSVDWIWLGADRDHSGKLSLLMLSNKLPLSIYLN